MPMQLPSKCYDNLYGCRKRGIRQRKGTHPDAMVVIILAVVFGIVLFALATCIIYQWRRLNGTKDKAPQHARSVLNIDLEFGEEPVMVLEYQDGVSGRGESESSDENAGSALGGRRVRSIGVQTEDEIIVGEENNGIDISNLSYL